MSNTAQRTDEGPGQEEDLGTNLNGDAATSTNTEVSRQAPSRYTDYLESIIPRHPEFKGILNIMKKFRQTLYLISPAMFMRAHILDIGNSSIISRYDFSGKDNMGVWGLRGAGTFREKVETCPGPGTRTRIILFGLDTNFFGPPTGIVDILDTFGLAWNLDPRFVATVIHRFSETTSDPQGTLSPSFLDFHLSSRLWWDHEQLFALACMAGNSFSPIGIDDEKTKVLLIIVNARAACPPEEQFTYINDVPLPSTITLQRCDETSNAFTMGKRDFMDIYLRNLSKLEAHEISSANSQPVEYLDGLLSIFEAFLCKYIYRIRRIHQEWIKRQNGPTAEQDRQIYQAWQRIRMLLDSFQTMITDIEDYCNANATIQGSDSHNDVPLRPDKIRTMTRRLRKRLSEAQTAEILVRDTLQLHVGNLSLQESRRSITQANSVGRVTFLAFIFFPLSLITSFFGMNIIELNGNGPEMKWFIVTAVSFSTFTFLCWFVWLLFGNMTSKFKWWQKSQGGRNLRRYSGADRLIHELERYDRKLLGWIEGLRGSKPDETSPQKHGWELWRVAFLVYILVALREICRASESALYLCTAWIQFLREVDFDSVWGIWRRPLVRERGSGFYEVETGGQRWAYLIDPPRLDP